MVHSDAFQPFADVLENQTSAEAKSPVGQESREDLVSRLTSYLTQLGLKDEQLGKVMALLDGAGEQNRPEAAPEKSQTVETSLPDLPAPTKTIKLYIAEEQPMLKQAYQTFFGLQSSIEMVGSSDDTRSESVIEAARKLGPEVILLGVKKVDGRTVEKLQAIREACPILGIFLLFANFDVTGITALREFSRSSSAGRAYLLKHTVDTVEQLTQVVHSVAQGRVIIDPMVMEEMMRPEENLIDSVRDLSPRTMEVLRCLAKGYRNETIANAMSRDVKTIERHINNIYTTLQEGENDTSHPRVRAALVYLRATGMLPVDQRLLNKG